MPLLTVPSCHIFSIIRDATLVLMMLQSSFVSKGGFNGEDELTILTGLEDGKSVSAPLFVTPAAPGDECTNDMPRVFISSESTSPVTRT